MKRTLLEILGALMAVVMMASLHHQIARLEVRQDDVAQLAVKVEEASERAAAREEVDEVRAELASLVAQRLVAIEERVEEASRGAGDAVYLKHELEQARREAALIRAEVTRDVAQTREMLDSYRQELAAKDADVLARAEETQQYVEALTGRVVPDPRELTRDLLSPTVQLNGRETVGSGTIVYSQRNPLTGTDETWVLTAYHVVRNILTDSPQAGRDGIEITVYTNSGERILVRADLMAHNRDIDAAVLKLRGVRLFDQVATVASEARTQHVRVWDEIYAIGCPLGNDPIPTKGAISSTQNKLNGTNYWMINAPTYYGNSGGGVFLANSRELIGVFSKIYTHGRGTPVVIPHMGLCTPIATIYDWLESEKLSHLLAGYQPELDPSRLAAPAK